MDADDDEDAFPPDYFDDDAETAKGNSSGGNRNRPDSVYCVVGGYNEFGAVPFVSQVLQRRSRQVRLV